MPLHHYRVLPALALAIGAVRRPGEWHVTLRARSEALGLELRLDSAACAGLARALREAATGFGGPLFDLSPTAGHSADSPHVLAPFDLEAAVAALEVTPHRSRRLLGIRAHGEANGGPFLAEVWATPEQMLAVAEQAEGVAALVRGTCPTCGASIAGGKHSCQVH